jgi:3-oxoadipate enol-lactonase
MPYIQINGANLFYEEAGTGTETIVFIHGLMLASDSWAVQRNLFARTHRVVTFDLRGQGKSDRTRERLDLDSLAEDSAGIIEQLGQGPCHVVGFSMGAFIAMRLAARRPELVRSLALCGASAEAEERSNMPRYKLMLALVALFGPRPIASKMMEILFGKTYLASPKHADERDYWRGVVESLPKDVRFAAAASAKRKAITGELAQIVAPTLVIAGSEDKPVSPAQARKVASGILGAKWIPVADTGHAVMIEKPGLFNDILAEFLRDVRLA